MKSDIKHPRRACLICSTIHCCSRLDNCASSPRYDTAKVFSCGSFVRVNVSELSAHTKFHYSELNCCTSGLQRSTASDCNIKVHLFAVLSNSHASQCGSITDERWCKVPQGIILKFLAHANDGQRMKHLEMGLNLCRFRCASVRQRSHQQDNNMQKHLIPLML